MGVVVMPYFKPYANGVAITENPFRADFTAFFLNTQLGSRYLLLVALGRSFLIYKPGN
jgi:hypothetical protein